MSLSFRHLIGLLASASILTGAFATNERGMMYLQSALSIPTNVFPFLSHIHLEGVPGYLLAFVLMVLMILSLFVIPIALYGVLFWTLIETIISFYNCSFQRLIRLSGLYSLIASVIAIGFLLANLDYAKVSHTEHSSFHIEALFWIWPNAFFAFSIAYFVTYLLRYKKAEQGAAANP